MNSYFILPPGPRGLARPLHIQMLLPYIYIYISIPACWRSHIRQVPMEWPPCLSTSGSPGFAHFSMPKERYFNVAHPWNIFSELKGQFAENPALEW